MLLYLQSTKTIAKCGNCFVVNYLYLKLGSVHTQPFRVDYFCSLSELFYFLISRYLDGERLEFEDEKIVMEKLLAYHPYSKDKIGCGLDFIMVRKFGLTYISFFLGILCISSSNHLDR